MSDAEPRAYQPGDVANGYVLTADGTWVPVAQVSPPAATSSAALTSLVTGLIGLIVSWMPLYGLMGWFLGPMALISGVRGLRRGTGKEKAMSVAGMLCGVLTLGVCTAWAVLFFSGLSEG